MESRSATHSHRLLAHALIMDFSHTYTRPRPPRHWHFTPRRNKQKKNAPPAFEDWWLYDKSHRFSLYVGWKCDSQIRAQMYYTHTPTHTHKHMPHHYTLLPLDADLPFFLPVLLSFVFYPDLWGCSGLLTISGRAGLSVGTIPSCSSTITTIISWRGKLIHLTRRAQSEGCEGIGRRSVYHTWSTIKYQDYITGVNKNDMVFFSLPFMFSLPHTC